MNKAFYILIFCIVFPFSKSSAQLSTDCKGSNSIAIDSFLNISKVGILDSTTLICSLKKYEAIHDSIDKSRLAEQLRAFRKHYETNYHYSISIHISALEARSWKSIDSLKKYNVCLLDAAQYHYRLGQYVPSLKLIQEVIDNAKALENEKLQIQSLYQLSWSLLRIKRYNDAFNAINSYYNLANKLKLKRTYFINYYHFLSTLSREKNEYPKANLYNDTAVVLAKQLNDPLLLSKVKTNYASSTLNAKDIDPLIKNLKQDHRLISAHHDLHRESENYYNLGLLYFQKGQLDSVTFYCEKALQIQKRVGDKYNEYLTHRLLATNFEKLNRYKNAFEEYEKATTLFIDLFGPNSAIDIFNIEEEKAKNDLALVRLELQKQNAEIKHDILKSNQKILFILFGSLFIIALVSLSYYRNHQNQKLERIRLKKEAEKEIIALKRQAVRTQLNPHYLFNNLSAIKSYIAKNEPRSATRYLNKFALLMRNILNNSIRTKINLEEELSALKLFLEVERYRMKASINEEINVDENLDPIRIQVNPGFLQPFIENAFHQYYKKDNLFKVTVNIHTLNKTEYEICMSMYRGETYSKSKTLSSLSNTDNAHSVKELFDENDQLVGTQLKLRLPRL